MCVVDSVREMCSILSNFTMIEKRLIYSFIFLFTLYLSYVQGFSIKNCSSNYINEIEWNESEKKAIIEVQKDQLIGDPRYLYGDYSDNYQRDVRIWCDSDTLINKCSLEHDSKGTVITACQKDIPLECDDSSSSCQQPYNNIRAIQTSNHRCEFLFSKIRKTGISNRGS